MQFFEVAQLSAFVWVRMLCNVFTDLKAVLILISYQILLEYILLCSVFFEVWYSVMVWVMRFSGYPCRNILDPYFEPQCLFSATTGLNPIKTSGLDQSKIKCFDDICIEGE